MLVKIPAHVGAPAHDGVRLGSMWDPPAMLPLWTPAISGWWYTYPSEKYENQLGLFPKYGKIKIMFQTTNQLYMHHRSLPTCKRLSIPVPSRRSLPASGPPWALRSWIFPECVARFPVSRGLKVCSLDVAEPFATVRNRSQPSASVRANSIWPCLWEVLQRWSFLEVSDVSLLRFAWQAWHFVTFRRVLQRVENRFAWQAQYFCDVLRRCVAVFVAGAALWTCPSSFFVAGAAL